MGGIEKRLIRRTLMYVAVISMILFFIPGCTTDLYENIQNMVEEEAAGDGTGDGGGDGNGNGDENGDGGDTTPPAVASTSPANNATDVGINTNITATFTEAIDASTIDVSSFTVSDGSSSIGGQVSYSETNMTATFDPDENLSTRTTFTVRITTAVKDLSGNALDVDYTWSFTTGRGLYYTDFSATPESGGVRLTVTFTDESNFETTAWEWDFDNDGVVDSTRQNPVYRYYRTGTYTVRHSSSGLSGSFIEVKNDFIDVVFGTPLKNVVDTDVESAVAVHAADIDRDGDMDLLGAGCHGSGEVVWWENTGDGVFGNKQRIDEVAENFDFARSVCAIDVDRDGDLDAVSTAVNYDIVAWWENTGGGTYGDMQTIDESFNGATTVCAADLNGDGLLDLLGSGQFGGDIAWWENTGLGSFDTRQDIDTDFSGALSACAADVDGDGDLDVLGAAEDADDIAWWENTGGGTFGAQQTIDGSFDGACWVHAADVDGDGDLDVLGAANVADDVAWWENTGGGDFGTAKTIEGDFNGAYCVLSIDLDSDGDMDVLGAARGGDKITWWENDGDGDFSTARSIEGDFDGAMSVVGADVDGDGDLDVVGAAYDGDDIAWWEIIRNDETQVDWPIPIENAIDDDFNGAASVRAADLDCDGDMDVLGAAFNADDIAWWENMGGGSFSTKKNIDGSFDGAVSVYAADVDGDGDLDVLGAGGDADKIALWKNTGGGTFGAIEIIDVNFFDARSVCAEDLDCDGDMDVLGAAAESDDITWWENAGDGSFGTAQIIDGNFDGAYSVYAADFDGDTDLDVVGAASDADNIAWWENTNGQGTFGTAQTIDGNFNGASSVCAADIDGDGDMDVVGAASNADDIAWWENDGEGAFGTAQIIDGDFKGASSVHAYDVDMDGDLDVIATAAVEGYVTWWENTDGQGTFERTQTIDDNYEGASSVYVADVDGDGDPDVLGAASVADDVTWWEILR